MFRIRKNGNSVNTESRLSRKPIVASWPRTLLVAFAVFAAATCGIGCPPGPVPPSNLSVTAQTQDTYYGTDVSAGTKVYLTVRGHEFAKNASVVISAIVPAMGNRTFGSSITDSNGDFLFVTETVCSTHDTSAWNTEVQIIAKQPSNGWFGGAGVNGGVFVCCQPPPPETPPSYPPYSVTAAVPPWTAGQSFSCPQLPPPSGSTGSGVGLGGCSAPGEAGCACKAGSVCDSHLVCLAGSTCYPCGGYGEPCCSKNSCSSGYKCQSSPAQNSYSCLP